MIIMIKCKGYLQQGGSLDLEYNGFNDKFKLTSSFGGKVLITLHDITMIHSLVDMLLDKVNTYQNKHGIVKTNNELIIYQYNFGKLEDILHISVLPNEFPEIAKMFEKFIGAIENELTAEVSSDKNTYGCSGCCDGVGGHCYDCDGDNEDEDDDDCNYCKDCGGCINCGYCECDTHEDCEKCNDCGECIDCGNCECKTKSINKATIPNSVIKTVDSDILQIFSITGKLTENVYAITDDKLEIVELQILHSKTDIDNLIKELLALKKLI